MKKICGEKIFEKIKNSFSKLVQKILKKYLEKKIGIRPFPENKYNLKNGTVLEARFCDSGANLNPGDKIRIFFNGSVISFDRTIENGNILNWSIEMITGEIDSNFWKIISEK